MLQHTPLNMQVQRSLEPAYSRLLLIRLTVQEISLFNKRREEKFTLNKIVQ